MPCSMRMPIAAEEYKISFKSPVVTPTPLSLTLTASGVSKYLYTEPCWHGLLSLWGCQELENKIEAMDHLITAPSSGSLKCADVRLCHCTGGQWAWAFSGSGVFSTVCSQGQ